MMTTSAADTTSVAGMSSADREPAAYAINGQAVSAEAFYRVACDSGRSVCVEACAGAGKTWMLVERIIHALQQQVAENPGAAIRPDEILAITFTKKAAGEMRDRLQQRLASPELASLRAQLLGRGRSVQLLTFHAWFGQLLKAAPLSFLQEMGYPLSYELLEDDSTLLPELRQAFYAAALQDAALHADLAALVQELGRTKLDEALVSLLAKRTEFELTDTAGRLEESVQKAAFFYPEFAEILQTHGLQALPDKAWMEDRPASLALLGLAARVLGKYITKELQEAATKLETALTSGCWADVQAALLTKALTPRTFRSKLADEDRAALVAAQAYVLEVLAVQHQHACWLYQQRMVRTGRAWLACFAKLKREQGLVDMADLERAATQLLASHELASSVQERLDQRLRHIMVDEFQDTNPLQWQAMYAWLASYAGSGGGQRRPSLFIVGDPKQSIYRFRRAEPRVFAAAQVFMQDVFDAALLSCDHTRRNSAAVLEVVNGAFHAATQAHHYQGFRTHTTASAQPGQALYLPLIERERVDKEQAQASKEQVPSAAQTRAWRDSLNAPRFDAEISRKEREAAQAAWLIAGYLATETPPSVMVLARRHASLALMQQALQQIGIASQLQEKQMLADVPAVQDVLALLQALISPRSDLDLARALKSPVFGWTDEQLMALRLAQLKAAQLEGAQTIEPKHRIQSAWFDLLTGGLREPLSDESLVNEPFANGARVGAQLLRWQAWLHQLPPHDALQAIYDDGDILNKYLAAMPSPIRLASHLALQALLWAALQEGGGRFLTAYGFVRAMRAASQSIKAPASSGGAAQTQQSSVELLTIHGAKGLEADVVLLLDSDAEPRKAQTMTTLVDWPPEQNAPRRLVFLQSEAKPPRCAASLLADDLAAREVEELNTLYVAATRARDVLVVSAHQAHRPHAGSAWHRLQPLCQPAPAPQTLPPSVPATLPAPESAAVPAPAASDALHLPISFGLSLPQSGLSLGTPPVSVPAPVSPEATQQGLALHRLLQWQSTSDAALAAVAQEFGLTQEQAWQAREQTEQIQNGQAAWLWDATHIDWQANEYELFDPVHTSGRVLRIDRLVRHRASQVWWVIDFKSSDQPEQSSRLRAQLATYQTAVAHIFQVPLHQVQAAFVTSQGRLVMLSDKL